MTITTFTEQDDGKDFMKSFADRLGLKVDTNNPIPDLNCLRSVVMDPFVSDTQAGS